MAMNKHERIQASAMAAETVDNLLIAENNAKVIEESMHSAIMAALEEIGLVAEGYAKRLCPVDTGRLRNSITHAIFDGSEPYVVIGSNVEYAPAVHEGVQSQNRKGVPFLRDAATQHSTEYRRILESKLSGA